MSDKARRRPGTYGYRRSVTIHAEVLPPFRYDPTKPGRGKVRGIGFKSITDRKPPS